MSRIGLLMAGVCVLGLVPSVGRAEFGRPMIEVGSGIEVTPSQPVEVLLRVTIDNLTYHREGAVSNWVIARIKGNLGMTNTDEGKKVAYSDIEFVPVTFHQGGGISGTDIRILPGRFGRNIRLGEDATVRVDVAGIGKAYLGASGIHERAMIFAKVAADALGYKMASGIADRAAFHGFNLGALSGEAGMLLAAGKGFVIRVAFGGSADLSLGGNVGGGFAIQSDLSAYNEVSVDIKKFMRLFIRNGLNRASNSELETESEYQLMLGATFIF